MSSEQRHNHLLRFPTKSSGMAPCCNPCAAHILAAAVAILQIGRKSGAGSRATTAKHLLALFWRARRCFRSVPVAGLRMFCAPSSFFDRLWTVAASQHRTDWKTV
jgi:hypothetical protein